MSHPEEDFATATFLAREEASAWARCFSQLDSIRALDDNWDDAGALAIDPRIVDSAQFALENFRKARSSTPPTRVVASPSGSVVIEWHESTDFYAGAEIEEPGTIEWMIRGPSGRVEFQTEHMGHPFRRSEPQIEYAEEVNCAEGFFISPGAALVG